MAVDSFKNTEVMIPRGQPVPDFSTFGIEVSHQFVGNEYAKLFNMPIGTVIGQHSHSRDHRSALILGTVRVRANGRTTLFKAPANVVIKAGVPHEVHAMTPVLWACIWDNPQGEKDPDKFDATVISGQ